MTNQQYISLRLRIEKKYIPGILRALMNVSRTVADNVRNYGYQEAIRRLSVELVNQELDEPISRLYKEVGMTAAYFTLRDLKKSVRNNQKRANFGYSEAWAESILDYYRQYATQKIVLPISQTTRELILNLLNSAVANGLSVDEAARQLTNSDLLRFQAERIVRTETTSAFGHGQFIGGQSFEFETVKKWQEVKDRRTRRSHKHSTGVGGEQVDMEAKFSNGLMYPGDKEGSAREVINCRCRLSVVGKRDDNGRLIQKKPKFTQTAPQAEIIPIQQTQRTSTLISGLASLIARLFQ